MYFVRHVSSLWLLVVTLLLPSVGNSETMNDLIENDGLLYRKTTGDLFSGEVTGRYIGKVINGKRHGRWIATYHNGQTYFRKDYDNGLKDGLSVMFSDDGQVMFMGYYEQDRLNGVVISGTPEKSIRGGTLMGYWENGVRVYDPYESHPDRQQDRRLYLDDHLND